MSTVIFVGGATACGKSTLAKELNKKLLNSTMYRRYQAFFDIAMQKGIFEDEIFSKISSDEVDDFFVEVCEKSDIVISDVHYAIQLGRNGIDSNSFFDIYQKYVPTISKKLLQKLLEKKIKIIAIYLSCSSEQCLIRENLRYINGQKKIRNYSFEDSVLENLAERREWNNLIESGLLDGLDLNSELYSPEQLVSYSLKYLEKQPIETKRISLKKEK